MKRYKWTIYDRASGEKLTAGIDWADNLQDLMQSCLASVLRDFYKTADEVRFSVKEL